MSGQMNNPVGTVRPEIDIKIQVILISGKIEASYSIE